CHYCDFKFTRLNESNCTSVTDFDDCPGNITDFCPENIVCACKDGEPFCKCLNFRGQWGNYWFMGAKCDQLWNTLDLILVATLPGIGLALIVGVTIQTIHYCKKNSKKNIDNNREQKSLSGLQPQHKSEYAFDTHLRPPQLDQGQVNTEIHLTNKLSLQKRPEKKKALEKLKKNLEIKAVVRDNKMKCYQKIKLHKYGMIDLMVYIKSTGQAWGNYTVNDHYLPPPPLFVSR
uniref:Uncharacterized protein n=1 Tax=Sciurus vulgaris TaxID=55149 RepID=A0A8D2DZ10_SCIVU